MPSKKTVVKDAKASSQQSLRGFSNPITQDNKPLSKRGQGSASKLVEREHAKEGDQDQHEAIKAEEEDYRTDGDADEAFQAAIKKSIADTKRKREGRPRSSTGAVPKARVSPKPGRRRPPRTRTRPTQIGQWQAQTPLVPWLDIRKDDTDATLSLISTHVDDHPWIISVSAPKVNLQMKTRKPSEVELKTVAKGKGKAKASPSPFPSDSDAFDCASSDDYGFPVDDNFQSAPPSEFHEIYYDSELTSGEEDAIEVLQAKSIHDLKAGSRKARQTQGRYDDGLNDLHISCKYRIGKTAEKTLPVLYASAYGIKPTFGIKTLGARIVDLIDIGDRLELSFTSKRLDENHPWPPGWIGGVEKVEDVLDKDIPPIVVTFATPKWGPEFAVGKLGKTPKDRAMQTAQEEERSRMMTRRNELVAQGIEVEPTYDGNQTTLYAYDQPEWPIEVPSSKLDKLPGKLVFEFSRTTAEEWHLYQQYNARS